MVLFAVKPGLPAAKAGMIGVREDIRGNIHLGDVIIAIDGEPVTNEDSMLSLLENRQPGDVVKVTCLRDDEIKEFELKLAAPSSSYNNSSMTAMLVIRNSPRLHPRAMVLCHVLFLSACITQPTTPGTAETGTELRMAIPNDWQQIEQIRLPSMNMSLARRLPRATTEIRLEHHVFLFRQAMIWQP